MAYTNSSLVSYTQLSPNCTRNRNHTIDSVAIHCMAGDLSIESCGGLFANSSVGASSNYGIGSDGRIGLYVQEKDRSWCTSKGLVDHRAITIEVANTKAAHPWPVSDAAYNSLINLLIDVCRRNNISALRWKADKSYALSTLSGNNSEQNMYVHRWFSGKACPGDFLYNRHKQIAEAVNKGLRDGTTFGAGVPSVEDGYSTPSSVTSQYTAAAKTAIFIGDSRTVGMQQSVGANTDIWSCKVSTGYSWMVSKGVPDIENKVSSDTAVVILMGVNDLLFVSADKYTDYINKKAAEWAAKGASTYFVSVNPVKVVASLSNTVIESFNSAMRNKLQGVQYIDTYGLIKDSFGSSDGLHYDRKTYKQIYNYIKDQIGNTYTSSLRQIRMTVDHMKLNPYIISIPKSDLKVDYDALKKARVVGVTFEAGYTYTPISHKETTFKQPNLDRQVSAAMAADMPFGFTMIGRARTDDEAKKEMYDLSFIVKKYPPKLGVWIDIDFIQSATSNNRIMERYQRELIRLGLKQKMGAYVSEKQLKTIDWKKFQDEWYLWIKKPVDDLSELSQLLTPEFFDMDGEG